MKIGGKIARFYTPETIDEFVQIMQKEPKAFNAGNLSNVIVSSFGYDEHNKGVTSGSRVRFKNEQTGQYIDIHKPHPGSIMKAWMMKAIYQHLKINGLIK